MSNSETTIPVSILYKSIAGRYRPVRVADGPIMARYRFIKNASWGTAHAGVGEHDQRYMRVRMGKSGMLLMIKN